MNGFEYADKVAEADVLYPCKYGHSACALVKGGPCVDEELGNAQLAEHAKCGRYPDELPENDFWEGDSPNY